MNENDSLDVPEPVDRWETAGGAWRVAHLGPESATVDLLRCDGGEVVERIVVSDPAGLRWAQANQGEADL